MVEGRRCGLGAVKVSKRPQNGTPEPFSDINIALIIRPPIPYHTLDEGKRRQDAKIRRTLSALITRSKLAEVQQCLLWVVALPESRSPCSQHFSNGPGLGDASTRREWCISVENLA